jgi:hydroxymethylbilane synthase
VKKTWRLGTRGSALAVAQSQLVADALAARSGDRVELVRITTRGDQIVDRPLGEVGGKGLFTKELESSLLAGEIDLAVHSLKDLPSEQPEGLVLAAVPKRVDARDVLVGSTLAGLREGAVVGTGSARRRMQLHALRPDLDIRDVRGNVDTRIDKQRSGAFDAVVLAAAGLIRLGRRSDITEALSVDQMVPAPGQGVLGIQCKEEAWALRELLHKLGDEETGWAVEAERAFLAELGGGCSVPVGCHASFERHGRLELRAFHGRDDGVWVSERGRCAPQDAAAAGRELARHLVERLKHQPPRKAGD